LIGIGKSGLKSGAGKQRDLRIKRIQKGFLGSLPKFTIFAFSSRCNNTQKLNHAIIGHAQLLVMRNYLVMLNRFPFLGE
jgi:hypothetical protein